MANEELSQFTELAEGPAIADLFGVVDVSDTTDAASGTTKRNKAQYALGSQVNAQTGTTYTYLTTDFRKLVTHSNGSAIAGTLPQAGASFPAGWFMFVQNRGTGALTITPTTSTIDGAASLVLNQNEGAIIVSDGTNYFTFRGKTVVGGSGGAPADATYIVQTANSSLSAEQALGALATGILKSTTTTGVVSIATAADVGAPLYAVDAVGSDAYAITLSPAIAAYTDGMLIAFKAGTANTGAATLAVNGLAAKAIVKSAGGLSNALADNDIRAGQIVIVQYSSAADNFQMQSTLGNASGVSYPLLAPDGTQGAPSYAFSNGTDCGLYFVNGSPDHVKIGVGNKEFLDMYQGTGGKPVLLMTTNLDTKIGFGNGTLRSGFMDGGKGSVKAISDESGTAGCVFSATADLVDVLGTRRPYHTAGQVFRHVLTGNRTIGAVAADGGSNSISGIIITIILVQDATGGRTVSWDSSYKWAGGSAPTMTSAANAVDIYRFWCDGSNQAFEVSRSMDVK